MSSTFPTAKECGKCHVDIYQERSQFRVVTLEVFGIDAGSNSTLVRCWELAGESATAIPPQETRTWSLSLGNSFKTARAVLTRRSYDREALVLAKTQVEVVRP